MEATGNPIDPNVQLRQIREVRRQLAVIDAAREDLDDRGQPPAEGLEMQARSLLSTLVFHYTTLDDMISSGAAALPDEWKARP